MVAYSTRLGLQKDAGSEDYSVAVVNANLDRLDAAIGATVGTSASPPSGSAAWDGRFRLDSDAGQLYVRRASGWRRVLVSDGGGQTIVADLNLTGAATISSNLTVSGSATITGNLTVNGNFTASRRVSKAAGSTSRNTTITPTADPHLTVALAVGRYRVQLVLTVTGATGGDLRTSWGTTGTIAIDGRACLGPAAGMTDIQDTNMHARAYAGSSDVIYGTESDPAVVMEDLDVNVTVPGSLTLQWAQGTSTGTDTTLASSSRMYITPVA